MDAAEDDGPGLHPGGGAGELEAVAGEVGEFLDVTFLVVVGEDRGVLFALELLDFLNDVEHGRDPCFLCGGGKPTSGNLETAFRLQRIFILRVHTIKRQDRRPFLGSFIAIPADEKRMRCRLFASLPGDSSCPDII